MGGPPKPPPPGPPGPPPPPGRPPPPPPGPPGRPRPPAPGPPRPRAGAEDPSWADCCLGIMAGLGRGRPPVPPGRGMRSPVPGTPAPPGRGAPGRWSRPSGRAPASGRRLGRWVPMPWAGANGLLPGRGEPGFRPTVPGVGPPGRAAGRAPGRGAGAFDDGAGPSASGRFAAGCGAGAVVGAGAGAGAGALDAGLTPGRGPPGLGEVETPSSELTGAPGVARGPTGLGAGASGARSAGATGAVFSADGLGVLGAACFGDSGLGVSEGPLSDSRRRRTTGASSVDDGPRTYSPISLSLFKSSLLVIPISFAISWTRGLATTLLHGPDPMSGPVSFVACSSLDTHRVVMSVSPLSGSCRRGSSAFSDAATANRRRAIDHVTPPKAPDSTRMRSGPVVPPARGPVGPHARKRVAVPGAASPVPDRSVPGAGRLPAPEAGDWSPRRPPGRPAPGGARCPDQPFDDSRGRCAAAQPCSTTPALGPLRRAIHRASADTEKFTAR